MHNKNIHIYIFDNRKFDSDERRLKLHNLLDNEISYSDSFFLSAEGGKIIDDERKIASEVQKWLKVFAEKNSAGKRILCFFHLGQPAEDLEAFVNTLKNTNTQGQKIGVFFYSGNPDDSDRRKAIQTVRKSLSGCEKIIYEIRSVAAITKIIKTIAAEIKGTCDVDRLLTHSRMQALTDAVCELNRGLLSAHLEQSARLPDPKDYWPQDLITQYKELYASGLDPMTVSERINQWLGEKLEEVSL